METYEVSQQFQHLLHDEYDAGFGIRAAENRLSYQYLDRIEENPTGTHEPHQENMHMNDDDDDDDDSLQVLKGFLKEVDDKGHKVFKKLVSRVEKDVPIERIVRKTVRDCRGKPGSDMLEKIARKLNKGGEEDEPNSTADRGVDEDILQEIKLERFKVKAVNIVGAGVVKEEGQ